MGEEVGILNLSNVWILGKDENEGACGMYLGRALFFAAQLCNNVCRHFILADPVSMLAQWAHLFHSFELLVDTSLLSAIWSDSLAKT